MVLALTICDICPFSEVDMMISVLLNVFNTRASLLNLMKAMIEKEVAACGRIPILPLAAVLNADHSS